MNIRQILKYSFKNKSRIELPNSLILLITAKCNSNCSFCFFKNRLNKNYKELTFEELEKLSKSLPRILRLFISGGEPFLRNDLAEICQLFSINNKVDELTIPTNGLLPDRIAEFTEKIIKKIGKTHLMVSLSVDAPPLLNDKIRGVNGSFDKALETYKRLVDLKNNYPSLRVHMTTTISKYNYDSLEELIKLIKEKMPELNGHNFELIRDKHSEYSLNLPSLEKIIEFSKIQNKLNKENKKHFSYSWWKSKIAIPIKNYKNDLIIEILKNKKQVIPCFAGKLMGVVNEVGDVFLCELLPPVGNIKKRTFKEVWNSKEAERQREMIKNKGCFCTHTCFQGTNILFNPLVYFKILKYFF